MLRLALAFLIALMVLPPAVAQDTDDRYALIVGASGYTTVRSLLGPRNDVTLLVNTLLEQGMPRERIRVLADGLNEADYTTRVTPDGPPNRAEILAELDRLAQVAGPTSEVLIFFAGHGSQFPSADEADGLNEFYLPLDVRPSTTSGQPPANILLDDDLQPKLAAILNRGAFVWFVADACHSGSLSRAAETDRDSRYVTPEQLGATRQMIDAARAAAIARGNTQLRAASALEIEQGARFVGFYAAQPEQVTYESAAPKSLPGPQRRMHGEFTWSLVQAIRANRFDSYASIARRIIAQYWELHSEVAPYFEGSLHLTPMIGAGGDTVLPVIARSGNFYVRAGAIDGVGDGAIIAVIDASSSNQLELGRGVVTSGGMIESRIEIAQRTDPTGLIERARTEGGAQAARLGARVLQRSADFTLTIAPPRLLAPQTPGPGDAALLAQATQALGALATLQPDRQPVALELTAPNAAADIYPIVANNRLWLVHRGELLDLASNTPPFSLPANAVGVDALGRSLRVIARTRNLLRVTRAAMDSPVSRNLSAEVYIAPGQPLPNGDCPEHDSSERTQIPGNARRADATLSAPVSEHCNVVYIKVRNNGFEPLDVTPLHVNPWSQICFLGTYTGGETEGLRLNPNQARILSYTEQVDPRGGAQGPMHLVFIASPGATQGPARDYRYLASCGELDRLTDAPLRQAGLEGFDRLLQDAGYGNGQARNAPTDFSGGAVAVPMIMHRPG